MPDSLTFWTHPFFWDIVGIVLITLLVLKHVIWSLLKFLTWWYGKTDRKDVYWAEFWGAVCGVLIAIATVSFREWLNPNLAGALMLNGAFAFALKAMVQMVGTWIVHTEQKVRVRRGESTGASRIEDNTLIPALSRSLWAAAGSLAVLANGSVEPIWLGHWATMFLVSIVVCTYVTKIESTHTVSAVWDFLSRREQGHTPRDTK